LSAGAIFDIPMPMKSCSRREFLKVIGGAGLLTCAPPFTRAVQGLEDEFVRISILHTTDLHGHILPTVDYSGNADLGGLARCATQIRRWRRENPNSILIDLGDVYQGTDVGLRTKGELMIDLFNHLEYDAWIIGNHEFDWGMDTFRNAVARSTMPVLAANTVVDGRTPGEFNDRGHPLAKIQPYICKEFDGIKVAIVGVTTPGMLFWLPPEFTSGMDFEFPVEPVRRAINKAKGEGANAIVLAGHMGLKPRTGGDDFANNVIALTSEFPDVAAFIAGHTHQNIPSRLTNGVLLTQADHFGIHVGCIDFVFDRESKRPLQAEAICELMDSRIHLDAAVLFRSKSQLGESATALNQPVGELAETLRARSHPGEPSDVEKLIGTAMMEALRKHGISVDGAMHGTFEERNISPGPKTMRDIWNIIPYENYVVTAELLPQEMKDVMEEVYTSHEPRNLIGFDIATERTAKERRVVSMRLVDGRPLEPARRYAIAFNTFDARSAGHRFMKLRGLLDTPAANCKLHDLQTREALVDYFRRHKVVHRASAAPQRAAA
jgi:2',3'-cyclic-nucleotide 2'-phosphodiesterase (5'-nucleotidase family)